MGQPVVHWEIAAKDAAALAKLYADTFGWSAKEAMPGYVLMDTCASGTGIAGGIAQTSEQMGNMTGVNFYVEVDDIPAYLAKITAAGGSTIMAEQPIPEVGSFGVFKDPDGHVMGLYKPVRAYDPSELGGSKGEGCPVVHWELWSNDEKSNAAFYAQVFGWKPQTFYPGYEYMDTQTPIGIMGGIMKTQPDGQTWGTGL